MSSALEMEILRRERYERSDAEVRRLPGSVILPFKVRKREDVIETAEVGQQVTFQVRQASSERIRCWGLVARSKAWRSLTTSPRPLLRIGVDFRRLPSCAVKC